MKCYLTAKRTARGCYYGMVVSEQDYHERGPHACSHATPTKRSRDEALAAAREWAEEHGYSIYSVDEIAA